MKYVFTLVVLISFSCLAKAQTNMSPQKEYRQKRYLDSLQNRLKQQVIRINPQPHLVYNMPVVPLINEGEKTGMSGEDTIYTMKTDHMPLLKPKMKTTYIPNAADGKIFISPQIKKKP